MVEDLERSELFQGLSALQLAEVAHFCTRLILEDGEILIRESERDNCDLYLLIGGSVEIVSNDTQSTSGEVVISKEDNELFGEMAWLTGNKRAASVRCHGPVQAVRIDGDAFLAYLRTNPDLGFPLVHRLAVLVANRLGETNNLLKQILWNSGI